MASYTATLAPGSVLHSPERDYTIIKVLGQGGFGITYLVEGEVKIGNITAVVKFAIKEHFISRLCDRDRTSGNVAFSRPVADTVGNSLQSFIKEANRLHSLGISHPNIVKINEVFEANNTAYYVMEYLEGETLAAYVRRQGRLSAEETEYFMQPLTEAVAALHRARLAHYDIKPENIILSRGSDNMVRAVLIDFGLAKHYDQTGQATSAISTAGYSPGYAPMEQYAGLREFSPQSDVYSLGATMYFCLTGHDPAEAFAVRQADLIDELSQVTDQKLTSAIVHAMQLQREDRQADAAALLAEAYGQGTCQTYVSRPTETFTHNADTGQSVPTVVKMPDPPVRPVEAADPVEPDIEMNDNGSRSHKRLIIIGAVIAVVIMAAWLILNNSGKDHPADEPADSIAETSNLEDVFTNVIPSKTESSEPSAPSTTTSDNNPATPKTNNNPTSKENDEPHKPTAKEPELKPVTPKPENKSYLINTVEERPSFPGGEAKMYSWLANNLKYPETAAEERVEGRVLVEFDILANGQISNARIARSVHPDLDEEALRLVRSMPRWTPGKMGGHPITTTKYRLPINFKLRN